MNVLRQLEKAGPGTRHPSRDDKRLKHVSAMLGISGPLAAAKVRDEPPLGFPETPILERIGAVEQLGPGQLVGRHRVALIPALEIKDYSKYVSDHSMRVLNYKKPAAAQRIRYIEANR